MPLFNVIYEDKGFVRRKNIDWEITQAQGTKLTKKLIEAEVFPKHVKGVVGATVSYDSEKSEGEYMVFTAVTLTIEAVDLDTAECYAPPSKVLKAVAIALAKKNIQSISYEDNWEFVDADVLEVAT